MPAEGAGEMKRMTLCSSPPRDQLSISKVRVAPEVVVMVCFIRMWAVSDFWMASALASTSAAVRAWATAGSASIRAANRAGRKVRMTAPGCGVSLDRRASR